MKTPNRKIVELKQPLFRRIGKKVVRIDEEGLWLRGKHKKTWHGPLTWAEVASLLASRDPILVFADKQTGKRELERIGAE